MRKMIGGNKDYINLHARRLINVPSFQVLNMTSSGVNSKIGMAIGSMLHRIDYPVQLTPHDIGLSDWGVQFIEWEIVAMMIKENYKGDIILIEDEDVVLSSLLPDYKFYIVRWVEELREYYCKLEVVV